MKRLNKYISDTGFCSRREADALIESGHVQINGNKPELGTKVTDGDVVTVKGQKIKAVAENKSDRVYLAYHKPVGVTCTTERKIRGNIIDAIAYKQRIFPIGRLDKPSEGLILLTNDGDIVNKILRAENNHEKLYRVTVNKAINDNFINKMASGVPILNTVTLPCEVKQVSKLSFDIILQQGLNRQIRRMCEYCGYEVTKLVRKRIMHIDLTGLKVGQYRHLTPSEMKIMNASLVDSTKTYQATETTNKVIAPLNQQSKKAYVNPRSAKAKKQNKQTNGRKKLSINKPSK